MEISFGYMWTISTFALGLQTTYGIVAGKFANEGDYPFATVILRENKVICGGVLVTDVHVFTGCHCVGSWTDSSDSSTLHWEPDQSSYDYNFSTPSFAPRDDDEDERVDEPNGVSAAKNGFLLTSRAAHRLYKRQSSTNTTNATTTSMTTTTTATTVSPRTTTDSSTTLATTTQQFTGATDIFVVSVGNTTKPDKPMEKFTPFVLTEINIVAGTIWIYKFSRGQIRRAGNSFKHPRCNAKTVPWDYDFGIYRSNAPFVFDETRIVPMTIYHKDNEIFRRKFQSMIEGGAMCITIGWGATQLLNNSPNPYDHVFNRSGVNMSEKLKYTDVKLVTDELCNELLCFPPYNFCNGSNFQWAEVGIVCAMHVGRGDSCNVDDGNALICDGHVFGFANSGLDCQSIIPRFYTRLDYALDFYYSSVNEGAPFHFCDIISTVAVMLLLLYLIKTFS